MMMREVGGGSLGVRGKDSEGRVLVVGAGPVGLVAAVDLARRGIDVRVIDAATGPATGSRGKGLQPRSIEVLDDLGVAARIHAASRSRLPIRKYKGRIVVGDSEVNPGAPEPTALPALRCGMLSRRPMPPMMCAIPVIWPA